ncbi:hypothetical protein AVMA1855_20035 [Acidovorax sp. SUPP1855]|uniref:hypothetical protein n=1 Tax=Acidovorax sp. SUPP1855 TaxID=431774 RepID=UPI0023DE29D2|nr:hypothetical protein [Acidovorax sp. SUPP1855]GKS86481.1 hypothetical protein AVMA1855_20035 [Acidovorax sp. SUPP1855]
MKQYPKALYKDGNVLQHMVIVDSGEEEAGATAMGYQPAKPSEEKEAYPDVKHGESTALVDPVKTTLASEDPKDGYIYATSGSAPTPDFPIDNDRKYADEKTNRPVGRPRKNQG